MDVHMRTKWRAHLRGPTSTVQYSMLVINHIPFLESTACSCTSSSSLAALISAISASSLSVVPDSCSSRRARSCWRPGDRGAHCRTLARRTRTLLEEISHSGVSKKATNCMDLFTWIIDCSANDRTSLLVHHVIIGFVKRTKPMKSM